MAKIAIRGHSLLAKYKIIQYNTKQYFNFFYDLSNDVIFIVCLSIREEKRGENAKKNKKKKERK